MKKPSWVNILLLFVPGTIWGLSFPLTEIALETIPPLTITAFRTILVALFFIVALRLRRGTLPRTRQAWSLFLLLGLINDGLPFLLLTWGQVHLTSGLTTILISVNPFFTLLLAHYWTKNDRLTGYKIVGLGFGMLGVLVLIGPEALGGSTINLLAQGAVILGGLGYAIGSIITQRVLARDPQRDLGQKISEVLAGQLICSALIMLPIAFIFEEPFSVQPSARSVNSVVAQVVFGSGVALAVYYYLLHRTSPTYVSFVVYLIPIVGVIGGAYLLDETVTPQIFTALALTLVGVAILNRIIRWPRRPALSPAGD
jgi:drug/metabolite transporter (DMT)-like permease